MKIETWIGCEVPFQIWNEWPEKRSEHNNNNDDKHSEAFGAADRFKPTKLLSEHAYQLSVHSSELVREPVV